MPGDTIYKNYDEMSKKSMLIDSMTNYNKINRNDNNELLLGIEKSISRGFRRAKINNKIINKLPASNNTYEAEMSRW
jgi:hypothetical protein